MASESTDQTDGTGEGRDSSDAYRHHADTSFSSIQSTTNTDYSVRTEGSLAADVSRTSGPTLSGPDTVELFRTAVDKARHSMQESLTGEEKISNTVQLSLTVDLNRRGLESLPEEIVQILRQDVERIVLSHNQIRSLPYSFSECTNITYLNLRANQFKEFPRALFTLQKLQVLDLSRNKMVHLPEEIHNMKSMRFLSVMHNNIEDLPLSLGFLESLRLLKLTGNPLKESLKQIADGNDSAPSPLVTSIGENERDTVCTIRIKQYLKAEVAALESSGESSGSPLETPRPLKRNLSIRFPVVPASSSSESVGDKKSQAFVKPPVPARSHYRPGSAQGAALQNAIFRRPGVTPLLIGNERNRSNSESILQATQNTRNKRLAMASKRTPGLGVVNESSSSRNSYHLRGTSHGSVLKDKHGRAIRSAVGSGSSNPVSPIDELAQGTFIRRLSSVPEHRMDHRTADSFSEGARGLVFSLHLISPHVGALLSMINDDASPRPSLERVYYNASTHYERLDQEICKYDKIRAQDDKLRKRATKSVRNACRACIVAYTQVGQLLARCSRQLIGKGDQRYIRTLLYLTYGTTIECMNSFTNVKSGSKSFKALHNNKLVVPKIQENPPSLAVQSMTPTRERLWSNKRNRSDTLNSARNQLPPKAAMHPQSAVPSYINGRSRSNSRSNAFMGSTVSSVANTPCSGESFLIPGTSSIPSFEGIGMPGYTDHNQDVMFEKIYLELENAVSLGTTSLPTLCSQFGRCLEESAMSKFEGKSLSGFWEHLLERSRQCLNKCDALRLRLSTVKLKDPEVRYSMDFWGHVTKYMTSFLTLCGEIKKAKDMNEVQLAPLDSLRLLKSVHLCVKAVTSQLRESPWSFVLHGDPPPRSMAQPQWQTHNHLHGYSNGRLNGQYHTRDNSGSSSSPYMPTTPLSAALGPAAQATIPSVSSSSTLFDRSFQGDVFQRADSLLSMQSSMLQRR